MRRLWLWAPAVALVVAAACGGTRSASDDDDRAAGRSGSAGRAGGRGGADAQGGEGGDDSGAAAGRGGASANGGSAGRGSGGVAGGASGKGGTAGGGGSDLHCEGDEQDCTCIADPNDTWSTEGPECAGSPTAYCCAADTYPTAGTCSCFAWSCTDNGGTCSCNRLMLGGSPACGAGYERCCHDPTTNNCTCDHLTADCRDTQVPVASCTLDGTRCLLGDVRVDACRGEPVTAAGGTAGQGGSSGTANAGGQNGGAGTGGNGGTVAGGGNGGNSGAAGTGNTSGTSGSSGSGGSAGRSSVACDASFAIGADGFVRAPTASGDCWHGYASSGGDPGSTWMPTSFGACGMGCMLRLSGTVNAANEQTNYAGAVFVGFNLRQSAGSSMRNTVVPTGTSLVVDWVNAGASPEVRIQLAAGSSSSTRWCAILTTSPATIPYTSFNTECWQGGVGTAYAKQPIDAVQLVIPGGATPAAFDVTLVRIRDM
jgi:hypothetical protein